MFENAHAGIDIYNVWSPWIWHTNQEKTYHCASLMQIQCYALLQWETITVSKCRDLGYYRADQKYPFIMIYYKKKPSHFNILECRIYLRPNLQLYHHFVRLHTFQNCITLKKCNTGYSLFRRLHLHWNTALSLVSTETVLSTTLHVFTIL